MNDHLLDADLADLAREDDAAIQVPPYLEAQMLVAWDRRADPRSSMRFNRKAAAAIVITGALAASIVLALVLPRPLRPSPPPEPAPRPAAPVATAAVVEARPEPPPARVSAPLGRRIAPDRVVESGSFIALGPDLERGWSGSFQVARVRVPRDVLVDLGVLVEAHRAGEPVQADVMFGEDGLARAIRLSPVSRRMP